ncbi:hypothetical protein MVES_001971 [Malassezia vespertilionis]|uniref:Uncharacterized protein n=1 Tax=Malassezia vespertilionis TaxID=2020962 RepID=A0A2N1JB46_9BASI|nr:hypothetical protein MVES_001971 [Malassezia vespertilionis]
MPKKRGLGEGQGPLSAFLGIARRAKRAASPDYAEEEEQQLQAALTASLEEVVHVACPLCNVAFAAEMIESHASRTEMQMKEM